MKKLLVACAFLAAAPLFAESQQPPFEEKNWETNENFRNVFLELDALRSSVTGGGDIAANTVTSSTVTATAVIGTNVTASTLTVTNTITGGWLAAPYPIMIVEDQKTSGTDGGTCTSGSWMTRDLNTVTTTTISGASLSSNQITLPSGSYFVQWSAPATNTNGHQTLFTSTPTAVIVSTGTTEQSAGASLIQTRSTGSAMFSLSGDQAFELRHRCETTNASDGFGLGQGFTTEVYSRVEIWKLR